jgi:hypothetical protein
MVFFFFFFFFFWTTEKQRMRIKMQLALIKRTQKEYIFLKKGKINNMSCVDKKG